ncbi:E3 ubiquitin-protein ligase TRIM33 [Nymphon striatum]|nr:E3 ubiquitin-protein ligase TRIM33 [Nymphon striatum]
MEYLEVTENIGASHNRLRTALSFWGSIECTFCKSKLVDVKSDPILLCCLHAACKPCIQKNASDNCVTCASCKQECQLHRVLHHRFVVDFKEDASNKNSEIKHIACSCADKSDCSSYCKYCQEWLCDACVLAHRRVTLTRNHFIKSKEEVLKMYPSRKVQFFRCPMHSLEILTLYCESCEQFACRVCRLVEHRDHMCRYLSSVSEQYKSFAMTTLREYEMVRENYSSCIRNAQQLLQNRQTYVINREVELVKEIQEFVQQMSMLIRKLMAKVEHVLKFTESAVKNGSESALFYTKKLIEKQLGRSPKSTNQRY